MRDFLAGGGGTLPASSLSHNFLFLPFRFCRAAASKAEPLTITSEPLDVAKGEEGRDDPVVPPTFLGVLRPVPT